MDDTHQFPAFIAVINHTISALSPLQSEMNHHIGPNTKLINLHGRTLLPAFIDSHSHYSFSAVLLNQEFDVLPPPYGSVQSVKDILRNIKNHINDKNIP
jgi:predicted amidohydrolase YtcJ